MSDDQELEQAPPQADAAPETPPTEGGTSAPAETGDAAPEKPEEQQAPPAKAEAPDPNEHRRKLIAQLTGEVDPPKADDEDPPQETPADEDPPKAEEPKKEDPPKAEEPPPEDLTEVTNESVSRMKPGEARRKINRLVTRIKEVAPLADMAREIIQKCEENGLTPEDYRAWVALGLGVQKGDEAAIKQMVAFAQRYQPKPAEPAPAPAAPDTETEAWLKKQVEDMNMSPEAAAEVRKRLAPKAPPAPAAPAPQPPAPANQPSPQQLLQQRAVADLDRVESEYKAKLGPKWQELQPRVIETLKQHRGVHQSAWGTVYRMVIEAELAKAPKPAPIQPALRPGSGQPAAGSQQTFKTERDRVIHSYTG